MRPQTNYIVVHCSATEPNQNIGVEEIRQWHMAHGWDDVGYHVVIRRTGKIEFGRQMDAVGAHVRGHNRESVGICMIGGLDSEGRPANTFTRQQFDALHEVLDVLLLAYPGAEILGHRDFPGVQKECPCFDVKDWFE